MTHRLRAALAAVEARYPSGPPTAEDRQRIATDAGLPAQLGERLTGNTLGELTVDAEELAAAVQADDDPADDDQTAISEAREIAVTINTGRTGFTILTGPGRGDTSEQADRMDAIRSAANTLPNE